MHYTEYYEIHNSCESGDWIKDFSLREALKGSIMALDKTKVLNFFDELRKNVQSDNKHLIEFINVSRYLFLAVKDRKSDNELKRAIKILSESNYWLYYKEPFEDCLKRLGDLLEVEFIK